MSSPWPISITDVLHAQARLQPVLTQSPLRSYAGLDAAVGHDVRVLVKHENHLPTNAFKARNGLALITALDEDERRRGVVAATRGNHGQGIAWAGQQAGVRVVVCVPRGNNPEKNDAMRAFGAEVIEDGADYDEALAIAETLVAEEGLAMAHSTNDPRVIAGAGTIMLEMLQQRPDLDAVVLCVGGGSQAVGALTVVRALKPSVEVYGVQAAGASAIQQSWKRGEPVVTETAETFADGIATRRPYELTFDALCSGLTDFVTVTDSEIAEALRLLLATTHNLVEGAGATGLAGLQTLAGRLAGRTVGVVLSGGNIDRETLAAVIDGRL